jgi:hypothetical protein
VQRTISTARHAASPSQFASAASSSLRGVEPPPSSSSAAHAGGISTVTLVGPDPSNDRGTMSRRPKAQAKTAGALRTQPAQHLLDFGKSPAGGGRGAGQQPLQEQSGQQQLSRAGTAVATVRAGFALMCIMMYLGLNHSCRGV